MSKYYKTQSDEFIIQILQTWNLFEIDENDVDGMFKRAYGYLERNEKYRDAASLKKIEKNYRKILHEDSINKKRIINYIKIVKECDISSMTYKSVMNMFEKIYHYLIKEERFEECIIIKNIESEYMSNYNKRKILIK